MSKEVKEVIITVVLIGVLVVVVINNLKGAKKPKRTTPAKRTIPARSSSELVEVKPPVVAETADKKTLSQQKQRAENLDWGRNPFAYVGREGDKSYYTNALELKGISVGKDKKGYAFINNEIVTVGDTVGGYEVLKIEKDKVLLRKGSQSFYLVLPEE